MTTNNGRITLGVLANKIDNLHEDIGRLETKVDEVNAVKTGLAVLDSRMDGLDKRVTAWSLTNSIGAIVAGVLAAFGISQR